MPIASIPLSLIKKIDNISIINIRAVADSPVDISAPNSANASHIAVAPQTNHWVLYLETKGSKSIRLDPTPGADMSMILVVTQEENAYSKTAIKRVSSPAPGI